MANETISKSNKTFNYTSAADSITITGSGNKIYTKGGKDTITLSKGKNNLIDAGAGNDIITIGKKAGNGNTVKAGAGNDTVTVNGGKQTFDGGAGKDTFTVSAGTQVINGGAGNDAITVKGGNNHILRGGTGSDEYIINSKMTKSTRLTINQGDYKKKDADTLKLAQVSKSDVTYGLLDGTLTIKHKTTGAAIQVAGWNKNKLSQIIFKNGTVKGTAVKAGATAVTWKEGAKVSLNANKVASVLQIKGHKMGDVVATLNSKGQLVLREKDNNKGTLTISNWNNNTIGQVTFKYGNYSKTLTADEFKERIYTPVALKDNQTYSGGKNVHQEFQVNFSENTNIVINSANGVSDRIRFTNAGGWSNDHEDMFVNGNDLYLRNWDSEQRKDVDGQLVVKNIMTSSVREIEFSNQTYRLLTKSGNYMGSDTYSDRFMILDGVKTGTDNNVGDWDIAIDGMRANDLIDLRSVPVNSRYNSISGETDGTNMVLTFGYCPDPSYSTTLGTLRLKNFFNADGSVNTTYGYPLLRINREFYAGDGVDTAEYRSRWFDGFAWNRITGAYSVTGEAYTAATEKERNYRRLYLNAGTAKNDEVDLGTLAKPNNKFAWLYYASGGNDTITAHEGDMVLGASGEDTLNAEGRLSELRGGSDNDILVVRSTDFSNLDHVNAYGGSGDDVIEAWGSYHYLSGSSGNDDLNIHDDGSGEGHTCLALGGMDDDLIYVHDGYDHRAYGGRGNDRITAASGNDHQLYGGPDNDVIQILGGVTDSIAYGGTGNDELYILDGAENNQLLGGDGEDMLQVTGSRNSLFGGYDDDTLEVVSGEGNRLYGEAGDDVLTITGSGNSVLGDDANREETGNDTLTVKGGDRNMLWGCGGDDTLIIVDGHSNTLYGDDGDDTLEIVSGYENQIFGGEGNDIFAFGETYSGFNNYINDYDFDKDVIQVADAASVISEEQIAGTYNWKVTLQGGHSFTVIGAAETGVNYIYKN